MKRYELFMISVIIISGLYLINTVSAESNNRKFDKKNKTLIIINTTTNKDLLTVQQISVKPDIATMEEVFEITAFDDYKFNKLKDFNIRWQKFKGKKDITEAKWEILKNVEYNTSVPNYRRVGKNETISGILSYKNVTDAFNAQPWRNIDLGGRSAKEKWNITHNNGNRTIGFDHYQVINNNPLIIKFFWNTTEYIGNYLEEKYRDEWRPFQPDGKTIKKNESFTIKLTLYKQAEIGSFSFKTIPMFAGIEDDNLTWWNGSWDYRVDNPISNGFRPYQFSLNLSNLTGTNNATHIFLNGHSNINFSDIRFTLNNATPSSYWIEDNISGTVWVNVPLNGTINLYYGNPSAIDSSDGKNTFEFFDDFTSDLGSNPVISPTQAWEFGSCTPEPSCNRWGTIAKVNGIYYIYYANGATVTSDIGRATSSDLITWNKYSGNPVINDRIGPSLLKELDGQTPVFYGGKYWMLTMNADTTAIQLRSATAIDSNTWTLENNSLLTPGGGTWYSNGVFTNSFIRENGTYYIVIQGRNSNGDWQIGHFTASAPNGTYTNRGVLLSPSLAWENYGSNAYTIDPELRKFGNTYYLFYTGSSEYLASNSYATSSNISGPYTKSGILLAPLGNSYPPVLFKDFFYYMLTDNLGIGGIGKNLYKRADLNGLFGSPFKWDSGLSPTISGSQMLINDDREYVMSSQTFLYKALKIRAKYAPLTADNSYQLIGFGSNSIADDINSIKFESSDTDLLVISGDASNIQSQNIYSPDYFGSYHNYEILWKNGQAKFIIDNELKATLTNYVPNTALPVGIYNYATTADFYIDWVFVRNYTSPEPVWAAWTTEQSSQTESKPNLTSWSNNKTNNATQTLGVNINESVRFNATANQTITSWNWYKDDVNQINNYDNFTTSWSSGGTKTIKVNATNSNGTSNTVIWTITVLSPPPANITSWGNNKTNNATHTLGVNISESVRFNATANQTITSWNWYKDDVNQINNYDNFTTSWSSGGAKTIKVNATNDNGTSNTVIWNVNVNAGPSFIHFIDPTPANGTFITQNYAYINTIIYDPNTTGFIDWNRSLVGWWRFNGEEGENSAFFRDWSSWGNNATCSGINFPGSTTGKFG